MVVENQPEWWVKWLFYIGLEADGKLFVGAIWQFFVIVLILVAIGLFIGFMRKLLLRSGSPGEALARTLIDFGRSIEEITQISWQRTWALAELTIKETVRGWVVITFGVFVILLLFAAWFLDVKSDHPARLYLSAVLGFSYWLVLILALLLPVFSLPRDFQDRTITTIVTKPVYAIEIVVGRMIGFAAVCSILLLVMAGASYGFVVRGLDHNHTITAADLKPIPPRGGSKTSPGWEGETSFDRYHRHNVTLDANGNGRTDGAMDHYHSVTRIGEGENATYVVGPPEGMLRARIPLYGKIRFLDRSGNVTTEGINVGYEWTYRSYIEGDTKCAAIWLFSNVNSTSFPESEFPQGVPMEMNLRIFRTTKGDIVSPIPGTITIRNPDPLNKVESLPFPFKAKEFVTDEFIIPRKLKGRRNQGATEDLDLFADFAPNGQIEVVLQCKERAQFYGAAQADVYLKAAEGNFAFNVFKGFASNWFCMLILLSFGVMFSTFLSAPVAALATTGVFVLGYFRDFLLRVATGEVAGGGPAESFMRTIEQRNMTLQYEWSPAVAVVQVFDFIANKMMYVIGVLLPSFHEIGTAEYVAYGYNISFDLMMQQGLMTLGYLIIVSCIGYYFLRSREIAG